MTDLEEDAPKSSPQHHQYALDTRAIELAVKALSAVQSHEKSCDERMVYIRAGQERIEAILGGLTSDVSSKVREAHERMDHLVDAIAKNQNDATSRMLYISGTIVVLLLTALGALAVKVFFEAGR